MRLSFFDSDDDEEQNVQTKIMHERNHEIQQIEQDLVDLSEISVELAVMVDDQGESIDTAEQHTTEAVESTADGVQNLEQANVFTNKFRSRLIMGTSVGVAVTGGVLALFASPIIGLGIGLIGAAGIAGGALRFRKKSL